MQIGLRKQRCLNAMLYILRVFSFRTHQGSRKTPKLPKKVPSSFSNLAPTKACPHTKPQKTNMSSPTSVASSPSTAQSPKPSSASAPAKNSVYVGDLPADITEALLTKVFSQASPVLGVQIHKPRKPTREPRVFAYVAYSSAQEGKLIDTSSSHTHEIMRADSFDTLCQPLKADAAIREFNQTEFSGKPCRVMKAKRGSSIGPVEGNIFVKHLPLKLSALAFHDTFATFGEVLSSKLAVDHENTSKGYGFVQYATAEQAQKAIKETNGSTLDVEGADKPIHTSLYVKKETRPAAQEFTNLFFRNLPSNITLPSFTKTWSKYGVITSAVINVGKDGKPTGTAFANFEKPSAAAKVVKATRSTAPDGVYAVRALSKAEIERHQSRKSAKAPEVPASEI
jgi:polyadenylate-binding protein